MDFNNEIIDIIGLKKKISVKDKADNKNGK